MPRSVLRVAAFVRRAGRNIFPSKPQQGPGAFISSGPARSPRRNGAPATLSAEVPLPIHSRYLGRRPYRDRVLWTPPPPHSNSLLPRWSVKILAFPQEDSRRRTSDHPSGLLKPWESDPTTQPPEPSGGAHNLVPTTTLACRGQPAAAACCVEVPTCQPHTPPGSASQWKTAERSPRR